MVYTVHRPRALALIALASLGACTNREASLPAQPTTLQFATLTGQPGELDRGPTIRIHGRTFVMMTGQ